MWALARLWTRQEAELTREESEIGLEPGGVRYDWVAVVELGQRVNTLEQARYAREEELDCHRKELLTLQDKNQELQYQIEDLENR
ncbi:hypothetical protein NDU88_008441 [Pleurodeles waltl]|uniref:Uncharacterized protein n=1 Tax=Pleurodeles waltl TaxID=8319 RepID=A0AAV7QSU2_PLEWA|nr:hypothetical protein NDU88_008441 [Pleurodeles waltl]